jgi:branched-chain amino acid transport system substrate-binding protein
MKGMRTPGLLMVLSLGISAAAAQQPAAEPPPYASINRAAINYAGPDRETPRDLAGPEIKIGLIAPRQGARQAEGDALIAAAQMAIEDEAATPLPRGQRLALAVRDETGLWGRASSEIVRLAVDDRAVAIITSPDGRAAHLAEQVGNRLGIPILTLATDATTTQINIPWIFRIAPHDTAQAKAFAEAIYRERSLKKALLIAEDDHDGREGAAAFLKAAQRLNATPPETISIPSQAADLAAWEIPSRAGNAQAIVVWASAVIAARVVESVSGIHTPIFVCRKALQEPFLSLAKAHPSVWIPSPLPSRSGANRKDFEDRFEKRAGSRPTPAAAEVYDSVRLIARGLRQAGPNRARLRDALAAQLEYHGVSGRIAFDGAGNNNTMVILARLK